MHHSSGSLTCDAKSFFIRMTLRIEEDGKTIFTRDWDETIRRDMV